MKSEIKERWLTALRSGKYEQSKDALKSPEGYCCLGVLCDVVKGDLNINWENFDTITHDSIYEILGERSVLPSIVMNYCKLNNKNPFFELDNLAIDYLKSICDDDVNLEYIGNLAELNDAGANFNFIADVIERNL